MREQKKAEEIERLQGVLEGKTGTSRSAKGRKAYAQKRLDKLTGVTAEREKAERISELEKNLENRGPRSSRFRQRYKDELAELKGESPDQVNSFAQAVEDAVAESATPPPQRDRSGSGERIRRGQMEAAEREKALEMAMQQGDLVEGLTDSFGLVGRRGVEGALAGAADQEEPLIIDDSQFEEPEEVDIDVSEAAPEMDEKESGRLFKMIMGGDFDPVSPMDKGKMEVLKKAKAENPDLTDNQLALKIYRDYM